MTRITVLGCSACGKRREDHGHPHGGACSRFEGDDAMSDLLTKEERDALEYLRRCADTSVAKAVIATLDRLAPAPKPPEPLPHELPARWRSLTWKNFGPDSTEELCADELEAALKRERERREERIQGPVRSMVARVLDQPLGDKGKQDAIILGLLNDLESP